MKKNLKAMLIALCLCVGMVANAQEQSATFGVRGGLNISSMNGDSQGSDAKIGFNVGVTFDSGITDNLFLLSGLELTTKGVKIKGQYLDSEDFGGLLPSGEAKSTINLMYLNLPVHIGYKINVAENIKLVFDAGPYVAYGVGGKTTLKINGNKIGDGNSFSSNAFKEFDFGFGIGAGAEFGKFNARLGYDFGVVNIADSSEGTLRNANFSAGVGYKF